MHIIEKETIAILNDDKLTSIYNLWQEITANRDFEMIRNIYNYSKVNTYNNAVFICGAEHKKSLIEKISEYESKEEFKLNWSFGNNVNG